MKLVDAEEREEMKTQSDFLKDIKKSHEPMITSDLLDSLRDEYINENPFCIEEEVNKVFNFLKDKIHNI